MVIIRATQIKIIDSLNEVLQTSNIPHMMVDSLVELFHITDYGTPELYIIEVTEKDDTHLKAIELLKKSVLSYEIPIIALVDRYDAELIDLSIKLGADDVFYYPITQVVLQKRIKNLLANYRNREAYLNPANVSVKEIQEVQTVMIESLATLAEYRDPETGEHIKRTQNYVKALALSLMRKGMYADELTEKNIDLMYLSVPLHDIGKVGIPDDILLKPGKLTPEEFELMKTHTILGHEALMRTGSKIKDNEFLRYADDVAYTHQEKYDGSGYPRGLKGDEIPLIGRLMAVADVYDALTSKRVYKAAMTHEEACKIIEDGRGSHFDPDLIDAFVEIKPTFENIALTYKDTDSERHQPTQLNNMLENGVITSILVVDDSRIIRTILRNQLERLGFDVDEAENGLQGIDKVKEKNYELILSDVEMPKMGGYEFSKKAVEILGKDIIIIIMTASDYDASELVLKDAGAHGLLFKPVDLARLETKLLKILDERHIKLEDKVVKQNSTLING